MEKKSFVPHKIKIERRHNYFVDVNGLLVGQWGGYEELHEKGPNGEALFEVYYKRFSSRITINEYGFFYNLFSCKKYDAVIMLTPNLFICEKNNRLGIIDENGKDILHVSYNDIVPHKPFSENLKLFVVRTETGKFLFNLLSSQQSDVYDDIIIINDQLIYAQIFVRGIVYKLDNKYGLLDINGKMLLEAEYYFNETLKKLQYEFHGSQFPIVSFDNGFLFGRDVVNRYDLCFEVGDSSGLFYITKRKSKYGLLNNGLKCVSEPQFDDIILFKRSFCIEVRRTAYYDTKGKWVDVIFVICKKRRTYTLYNVQDCRCIIYGCTKMSYKLFNEAWLYIEFEKKGLYGYVTYSGIIVSTDEYDSIEISHYKYIVSKKGKYGVLDGDGTIIAPCIYDSIKCNQYGKVIAVCNGDEIILNPSNDSEDDVSVDFEYERPTYDQYAGSYAQDEMGYSDDDIDTIFDGDPDAYWNID